MVASVSGLYAMWSNLFKEAFKCVFFFYGILCVMTICNIFSCMPSDGIAFNLEFLFPLAKYTTGIEWNSVCLIFRSPSFIMKRYEDKACDLKNKNKTFFARIEREKSRIINQTVLYSQQTVWSKSKSSRLSNSSFYEFPPKVKKRKQHLTLILALWSSSLLAFQKVCWCQLLALCGNNSSAKYLL